MRKVFISVLSFAAAVLLSCGGGSGGGSNDNPDGDKAWTRLSGVSGERTYGSDIAADANGNSYIAGYTCGALDGKPLSGISDAFLIKYDPSGTKQWTNLLGSKGVQTCANSIAVDSNGCIYVAGYTEGNLNGQNITGTMDAFIVKYDSSGNILWTKLLGAAGENSEGKSIGIDAQGCIYLAGFTTGSLGGQTLSQFDDLFIAKYDKDANPVWLKYTNRPPCDSSDCYMTVDSNGNSYITGPAVQDFDGQTISGKEEDSFVIMYDTNGNKKWTKFIGDSSYDTAANDITADGNGSIYLVGQIVAVSGGIGAPHKTKTVFPNQVLKVKAESENYSFIAKLDSTGGKLWMKQFGSSDASFWIRGTGVAADKAGNVYMAGYTTGSIDGQTLTGSGDAFVIKYDANGERKWSKLNGAAGDKVRTYGRAIALDASGKTYVTGDTDGDLNGDKLSGTTDVFITTSFNEQYLSN